MTALMLIVAALPYLVAILLGLAIPLMAVLAFRSIGVGLALVIGVYALDSSILGSPGLNLGIHLYLPDLPLVLIALVAVARWLILREARQVGWAFGVLAAVVSINLLHGLVSLGTTAGVAVRPSFYALVSMLYVATFPFTVDRIRLLQRALLWCATAFVVLAVYRLVVTALDIRELLPLGGSFQPPGSSIWRVIYSDETLILGQAALTLWFFRSGVNPAARLYALVLLALIIGLQHRSVWLATLVGAFLVLFGQAKDRSRWFNGLAFAVVVAAIAVGVSQGGAERGIGSDIARSATDALQGRGTSRERLVSWAQLVENWATAGPRSLALGVPFGTVLERYNTEAGAGRRITYQPHNYYVEVLVTQGLIGFAAFLALCWRAVGATWRARTHPEFGAWSSWLLVMLVTQLTYYLTYGIGYVPALALGAGLALAARLKTECAAVSVVAPLPPEHPIVSASSQPGRA